MTDKPQTPPTTLPPQAPERQTLERLIAKLKADRPTSAPAPKEETNTDGRK